MTLGRNTEVGQELTTIVERVESVLAARQTMSDDIAAILAEAKVRGFVPKAIRACIKLRAMKPHQRQEDEALLTTYMHALGDEAESPLFRHVSSLKIDVASRADVASALKPLVPANGSIIVEAGGKGVKLTRDKDGKVEARDLAEPAFPSPGGAGRPPGSSGRTPAPAAPAITPDVDADGAEALGRAAFRDNEPIIKNPFPFGDDRRPRWDLGWRMESGSDGMGPSGGPGKGQP